jgi:plastocyanin
MTVVPVAAGLAVGIAVIILFSVNFQATPVIWSEEEKFTVIIPLGASLSDQKLTFKPEKTRAALDYNARCCGVVKWVNNDTVPAPLSASDQNDPGFYKATQDLIIEPGDSFEYIFTKPGEYGFQGRPWQHGVVEILRGAGE